MRTTPAMILPCALMMPEAVRISVSMRSFSTGARAGKALCSSAEVAERQEDFGCAIERRQRGEKKQGKGEAISWRSRFI